MTKIKCEINGQLTEIEVEDSFATAYLEIDSESKRNEWKHEWRRRKHQCSLEAITENGYQIAASDDVVGEVEQADEKAELKEAIGQLLPEQQELIRRVYFLEQSHTEIAAELGVDRSAISHRVARALAALKKIMQKN